MYKLAGAKLFGMEKFKGLKLVSAKGVRTITHEKWVAMIGVFRNTNNDDKSLIIAV